MPTKLTIDVPTGFRLRSVVHSHGWFDLPPFEWNAETVELVTATTLGDDALDIAIRQAADGSLEMNSASTVPRSKRPEVERIVGDMLGLSLEFDPFYQKAGKRFHWARELGMGRFLRGASAFEDVVKMLATTNCSWALTKLMTTRMVESLGAATPLGRRAFPTAKAMADVDLAYYRDEIRAGYRGEYFQRLARRVATGKADVESWPKFAGDVVDLGKLIRAEKGCGPYVVDNLCRLFGRFDGLGVDSFCRRKYVELFGEPDGDVNKAIRAKYKRFGQWQGLAMWLDFTKDWHIDSKSEKAMFRP